MKLGIKSEDATRRMKADAEVVRFFGFEEVDPTVPEWAKQENPPFISEDEVEEVVTEKVNETVKPVVEEVLPEMVAEEVKEAVGKEVEEAVEKAMEEVTETIDEKVAVSVDTKIQDIKYDEDVVATDDEAQEMLNEIFGNNPGTEVSE